MGAGIYPFCKNKEYATHFFVAFQLRTIGTRLQGALNCLHLALFLSLGSNHNVIALSFSYVAISYKYYHKKELQ